MYNECRHLFISGKKCGSPALTAQNFCYYHTAARKRQKHTADNQPYDRVLPKETALPLPALDEGDAIQLAISEVVLALAANTIDPRRARILLYGLQIASQHYRHKTSHCHPDRSRVPGILQNQDIVRETFLEEDGLELGLRLRALRFAQDDMDGLDAVVSHPFANFAKDGGTRFVQFAPEKRALLTQGFAPAVRFFDSAQLRSG